MQNVLTVVVGYLGKFTLPGFGVIDIIEIGLISFFVYQFMAWIKFTRAYTLLKGILIVLGFILVAYIFKMNTILWIFRNLANVLVIGVIVIFQPELRKALEQLGQKKFVSNIIPFDSGREVQERFNDKTINELVKACFDMGEVKTGALIVIEEEIRLDEYVRTGINIDGILTSQLLINIFEHNTPLHDGAVIVRGNRVVAATCYLPLSDNMELSKQLGQDTEQVWVSVKLRILLRSLFRKKRDRFLWPEAVSYPEGLTANSFEKYLFLLRIKRLLTTVS